MNDARHLLVRLSLAVAATTLLAGCASAPQDKVGAAVTAPLADLNIVSADIPEPLRDAQRAPYALPSMNCEAIAAQIKLLNDVLGPDIDTPPGEDPGLIERGGNLAVDAIRRSAEGLVPFRSWIRKLSGAERHSRQVAAAITAGGVRRGFLKGLARASNCAV